LEAEIESAQPLANLRRLNHDDTSSFLEHAQRLQALHRNWWDVSLAAPSGRQILNAASPDGSPQGDNAGIDGFSKATTTGKPVVGNFRLPPRAPVEAGIPLHYPVLRQALVRFVVTVTIDPKTFESTLQDADLPPGWDGALIDAAGTVVAGTGRRQGGSFGTGDHIDIDACCRDRASIHEETLPNGLAVYAVSQIVPLSNWTVHLTMPKSDLDEPVERAWRMIVLAGVGALVLTALLASLVAHYIAARRREELEGAAHELRLSEAWRLLAVEVADIGTWRWPFETGTIAWCERCRRLCRLQSPETELGDFLALVYADDRTAVDQAMTRCRSDLSPFEIDIRILTDDGTPFWIRMSGQVLEPDSGAAAGIYGVILSIDKQKRAEAEHRALLSRLHSAQEDERRRIARDLHDRVGQTVTGLSLRLKRLEVEVGSAMIGEACTELKGMVSDISQDIHRAAVELRPTALDDIGLKDALLTLLEDWRRQTGIDIEVFIKGLETSRLPPFIETTVYRILVELLTNVVKHARAKNVSVTLERRPAQVILIVEDDGRGFTESDPSELGGQAKGQRHLGLLGIRERLELVNGRMQIESELGGGTAAIVRIPLPTSAPLPAAAQNGEAA
jgi:signal transduction histidine kinase